MPTSDQISQLLDTTTELLTTVTEASSNINQASQVVTTAVSTHTAQPDPHGQYVQELTGAEPVFATVDAQGRPQGMRLRDGQVVGLAEPWLLEGRPSGTPFQQKVEGLPMPGGQSRTLLNVTGRGYVGSIFLASMAKIGTTAMDRVLNQRLEFYFDGATTPQYTVTLARFLCAEYMGTYTATPFRSDYIGASHLGGGDPGNTAITHAISGVNKMCFPFRTGLIIVLRNNGPAGAGDVHSIFSCISGVVGLPETDFTRWRLRINDGVYTSPTISEANNNHLPGQEQVLTMLQVPAGTRGRYFGLYHCLDGANVVEAVNVKHSPLEGNHKIYINNGSPVIGTTPPTLEWSGSEDYIGEVGWFGGPAPFATAAGDANTWEAAVGKYSGLTLLNNSWQGLFAGYRWHVPDPITFDNGFTLTWNVGDYAQRPWTGTCRVTWAAFWYEWVG